MQGVEQEVRIELHAKSFQPRIGELGLKLNGVRLQLDRLLLTKAVPVEVVPGEPGSENAGVYEEIVQKPGAKKDLRD